MKPVLKAPGTKRLKLTYDQLLSNYAFNFNLRHYNKVLVLKRSLAGGYADVENPLFYNANTNMVLGDAKCSIDEMKAALVGIFGPQCIVPA